MTRAEAAAILGLPENADKQAVNTAVRKLTVKYHPDSVQDKSPAEQAKAEEMFKKVNQAKKVMLAPPEKSQPAPAPSPSRPQQRSNTQSGGYYSQGRVNQPTTDPFADMGSFTREEYTSNKSRTKYNTATSFESNIPRTADNEESILNEMYEAETKTRYKRRGDIVRATLSLVPTTVFLILAFYQLFATTLSKGDVGAILSSPYLVIIGICLLKYIYDFVGSYYVNSALSRNDRVPKVSIMGVEMAVLGALFIFISKPIPCLPAVVLVFAGFAIIGIGYIIAMTKRKRREDILDEALYM